MTRTRRPLYNQLPLGRPKTTEEAERTSIKLCWIFLAGILVVTIYALVR